MSRGMAFKHVLADSSPSGSDHFWNILNLSPGAFPLLRGGHLSMFMLGIYKNESEPDKLL